MEKLTDLLQRYHELLKKMNQIEQKLDERLEVILTPNEKNVFHGCINSGLTKFFLCRTPDNYYDWNLTQRKEYLGAPSENHLCKSLIIENTKCEDKECLSIDNSRFYCIIMQYSTRYFSHKLFKYVRSLKNNSIARKYYHFRFSSEEESNKLTGFEHNAISPFGNKINIPIILSNKIALLGGYFFLGGGEKITKVGIDVNQYLERCKPLVADITYDDETPETQTNETQTEPDLTDNQK